MGTVNSQKRNMYEKLSGRSTKYPAIKMANMRRQAINLNLISVCNQYRTTPLTLQATQIR